MTRLAAALAAAAFALTALALAAIGPASSASADPIRTCTTTAGTVVVVDFAHWHGPFVRGCGVHPATGLQLLHDAGFTTAGDAHDGPSLICRLGNPAFAGGTQYPTPKTDPCATTPPASAYWSYWLAPKGQNTWSYSQLGAASDKPKPGEVELWQFGGTDVAGTEGRPSVTPAQLRAQNTAPTGAPSAPATRSTSAAGTTHAAVAGVPGRATRQRSSAPPRPTAAVTSTPTSTPTSTADVATSRSTTRPSPTVAASSTPARASSSVSSSAAAGVPTSSGSPAPSIVDARPASAATPSSSSGSPAPLVIGLVLVVLLGAGAAWTVVRRRRAGGPGY